jgi:outer membrane protein
VLSSRRQWIQAQTDYSRSRYDYMVNMVKLQQAAGILTEQSLSRLNALLKDAPPKPEAAEDAALSADAPP